MFQSYRLLHSFDMTASRFRKSSLRSFGCKSKTYEKKSSGGSTIGNVEKIHATKSVIGKSCIGVK